MADLIPNQISHITSAGRADTDNTTSANLADSGNFTGAWSRVPVGALLIVTIKSDVNLDITIEFSPDGTNADSSIIEYYRTGLSAGFYIFKILRPYVRVTIDNNSGSTSTILRLNSYVAEGEAITNIATDRAMAQDYPGLSVRPSDFFEEVRRGLRRGVVAIDKFGHDEDLDVADGRVTVWDPGIRLVPMESADTYTITYNNATDGLGTTGATELTFTHIDENEDLVTEVHTLGSTGSDVTSFTGFGINRCEVTAAGSTRMNTNNITIADTTNGDTQAFIPALHSITHQVFFFVPRNHVGIMQMICTSERTAAGQSPKVEFRVFIKDYSKNVDIERFQVLVDTAAALIADPKHTVVIETGASRTLIEMTAQTDQDNTYVGGWIDGTLYRNVDG